MIFIVDVNVVFSGAGARATAAAPRKLLELVLRREASIALSAALFQEYVEVLGRPKFLAWSQLTAGEVRILLESLAANADWTVPPRTARDCPDATDQHLWDLLAAVPGSLLVTGEKLLLGSDHFPGRVLTPRQAVERTGG